jgi:hypothetical protein
LRRASDSMQSRHDVTSTWLEERLFHLRKFCPSPTAPGECRSTVMPRIDRRDFRPPVRVRGGRRHPHLSTLFRFDHWLEPDSMNDDRDLYSGMIRLHVLHHAERGTIFGAGMSEELARHGYKISPGTMYPILHGLEKGATFSPAKSGPEEAYVASIESRLVGAAPSTEPNCACGNSSES